jgi:hypothetical protein
MDPAMVDRDREPIGDSGIDIEAGARWISPADRAAAVRRLPMAST